MADDETTEIQDTPQEPAAEAPVADEPGRGSGRGRPAAEEPAAAEEAPR